EPSRHHRHAHCLFPDFPGPRTKTIGPDDIERVHVTKRRGRAQRDAWRRCHGHSFEGAPYSARAGQENDSDTDADPDADPDPDRAPNASPGLPDANPDSDCDTNPHSATHTNPYAYPGADCYPYTDADATANPDADA